MAKQKKKSTAKRSSTSKKKTASKKTARAIVLGLRIAVRSRRGRPFWTIEQNNADPYEPGTDGLQSLAFTNIGSCRADVQIPMTTMMLLDVDSTEAEAPLDVPGSGVVQFTFDRYASVKNRWLLGKTKLKSNSKHTKRRWNADLMSPFALVINPTSPLTATVNTDGGPLTLPSTKVAIEFY